jgi:hypothetical protein
MQIQALKTAGGGFFHPFARSLGPVAAAPSAAGTQKASASPPARAQEASAEAGPLFTPPAALLALPGPARGPSVD